MSLNNYPASDNMANVSVAYPIRMVLVSSEAVTTRMSCIMTSDRECFKLFNRFKSFRDGSVLCLPPKKKTSCVQCF